MVLASCNLFHNSMAIRCTMGKNAIPKVSLIICSKDRPRELKRCLYYLNQQTFRDFDYKVVDLDEPLAYCREWGVCETRGEIVVWIDDDVETPECWLEHIVGIFDKNRDVVGVTGPTLVPESYKNNRDIFRYFSIYKLFNKSERPGYFSKWGAPSMFGNFSKDYCGEVDYLECCNMALRRETFIRAGGFDLSYEKTSEWSEVDLAMRCKKFGHLLFSPNCWVFHLPSTEGAYKDRLDTSHRYRNYIRFSDKHLKKCWQSAVYKKLYGWYLWWKGRIK